MNQTRKKMALIRGTMLFGFFIAIASVISILRENIFYLLMFSMIGAIAGFTEFIIASNPDKAQFFRKTSLIILALILFIIALIIGINFQFSQLFFDLYIGLISGALIQFVIARLLLPLIFGNIFCSRACWDGAAFEISEKFLPAIKKSTVTTNNFRSTSAWIYLLIIVALSIFISFYFSIKPETNTIRTVFILQNAAIISAGLILSAIYGQRIYCRKLCPFLTISGLLSPYSLFKVSPIQHEKCTGCAKCSKTCPMAINVENYVKKNMKIDHPDCIMCENCISICPQDCLIVRMK